jgi:hypothetical protein
MADLDGYGVDMAAIAVGSLIRLSGPNGPTASGVVERLDTPHLGYFEVRNLLGKPTGEVGLFHARNVCGLGAVCDRDGRLVPPNWALDYIDFPTGWHIQRQGVIHVDRRCSAVQAWGGFLCDCGAIEAE